MSKKIYLIGGLMVNDNFGDVIQAKVWVDRYTKNNFEITLICYEAGIERISGIFPNVEIESYESVMKRFKDSTFNESVFFHFYGGGYLNKYWGKDFAKLFGRLSKKKIPMIATGIQLDREFYQLYRKEVGQTPSFFYWVSFRDSNSKALMSKNSGYICDDVFFHLRQSKIKDSLYRISNVLPDRAFIQLSLNDYMYEGIEEEDLLIEFRKLIRNLSINNKIDFYSSFDKDKGKVKEAEYLYDKLNMNIKVRFKSVRGFSRKNFCIRGYRFAIVNSYHTYIVARKRLKCPVYFLALSKFYKQKASALQEYGLLNKNHCIGSLEELGKIEGLVYYLKDQTDHFRRMFELTDKIEREVDKLISILI